MKVSEGENSILSRARLESVLQQLISVATDEAADGAVADLLASRLVAIDCPAAARAVPVPVVPQKQQRASNVSYEPRVEKVLCQRL